MSEAQTRLSPSAASTRGRGSPRGARGSFTPRGARGATRNSNTNTFNGDPSDNGDSIEGELGALKKKYPSQLSKIKEMFPHLSSEDILMELQENNGDLHNTVVKFTEGTVSVCPLTPAPPYQVRFVLFSLACLHGLNPNCFPSKPCFPTFSCISNSS